MAEVLNGPLDASLLRAACWAHGPGLEMVVRRDRQQQSNQVDPTRMTQLMEGLLDRLEGLEARQDFTERVIESAGWMAEGGAGLPPRLDAERPGRTGGS